MKYHILVAVLALIGVSSVYAIETTVDVPFDNWANQRCALIEDGSYMCLWVPGEDSVMTPPSETIEETVVDEVEVIPEDVISEPVVQMTREEKDIQRIIDRITGDLIDRPNSVPNSDKQLLILLQRAQDVCEFGIEEGAPIQAYALFGIPQGNLYIDDTNFQRYIMLGNIAKLVEACEGWTVYKDKWLGPQYLNIETENRAPPGLNTEAINVFMSNVTITDEYMNRVITPHDFIQAEEDAATFMCSTEGKQRGFCPQGIGNDVYTPNTEGNPALAKYNEYKDNPDNAVGEPKYSVTTNPKCAILDSFITQNEISEENGDTMLMAAGCKLG